MNIEETFNLAFKNHNKNELQEAIKLYHEVLKIDPNYVNAHYNLVNIFYKLGEYQKAINCSEKAIAINPNYADAHNNLGVIFEKLGEYQKSKECFEKVIAINPNHAAAYNNIATICLKLKRFESYYDYNTKFLQLTSVETVSNSSLESIIPKVAKKLQHQNGVRSFFDNEVLTHLTEIKKPSSDFCEIFEKGQQSKEDRFISYSQRMNRFPTSEPQRLIKSLPYAISQGVHSLINWKGHPLYKSVYDLAIYQMIIQEVKPDVIIELGSGTGGSAIWLADTASALGLNTHVYSFDLIKPQINHNKVTFIEHDLNEANEHKVLPSWDLFKGKKILIEDAHVNLKKILYLFDTILNKDDYLIIEDSDFKQEIISNFSNKKETKYKLDQFFLDFFGTNVTCCTNSIFKCC